MNDNIPDLPKQQGGKGHKAERINMAFSPENSLFLRVVSKEYKVNMTALTNHIIDRYREEHPEILETALQRQAILESDLLPTKKETDTWPGRLRSM